LLPIAVKRFWLSILRRCCTKRLRRIALAKEKERRSLLARLKIDVHLDDAARRKTRSNSLS
jgi:hypothetical protein